MLSATNLRRKNAVRKGENPLRHTTSPSLLQTTTDPKHNTYSVGLERSNAVRVKPHPLARVPHAEAETRERPQVPFAEPEKNTQGTPRCSKKVLESDSPPRDTQLCRSDVAHPHLMGRAACDSTNSKEKWRLSFVLKREVWPLGSSWASIRVKWKESDFRNEHRLFWEIYT